MEIRTMRPPDWEAVKEIYEWGIATGNATFETSAPNFESWDALHLKFGRVVCLQDDKIVGWASLSAVSNRCVYGGVAEVSVYVHSDFKNKGAGQNLLNALIFESEANNIWTLQSGIFPENEVSVALHEKSGFRQIGLRERVGKLNGTWRDTLLLERRSNIIGIE